MVDIWNRMVNHHHHLPPMIGNRTLNDASWWVTSLLSQSTSCGDDSTVGLWIPNDGRWRGERQGSSHGDVVMARPPVGFMAEPLSHSKKKWQRKNRSTLRGKVGFSYGFKTGTPWCSAIQVIPIWGARCGPVALGSKEVEVVTWVATQR